jgi:hypothetical protein
MPAGADQRLAQTSEVGRWLKVKAEGGHRAEFELDELPRPTVGVSKRGGKRNSDAPHSTHFMDRPNGPTDRYIR